MIYFLLRCIRKVLSYSYGKFGHQKLFEGIHQMGLLGMNFGYPEDTEKNGEAFTIRYIKSKLQNEVVVFDVGANEGLYAKKVLNEFGKNLRLYCFEPSEKTFKQLQLSINDSRVSHHKIGIGDKREDRFLYSHAEHSGISSVFNRELRHNNLTYSSNESIEMETIDNFCEQNNIARIDFLKLDVEGNELFAFKGAEKMLKSKKIRFIQFEFGGTNIDSRTFFRDFWYLLNDNYKIYRIVTNGLQPISKYNEYCEVFITINYLAELKNI